MILDSLVTGGREFAADREFYEGDIADGPLVDRIFAEHPDIDAVRRRGSGASMRARSYHASPGPCQASVLCISLWMTSVNMLVNHYTAVDWRGCGKVDNRRDVTPHYSRRPGLAVGWYAPQVRQALDERTASLRQGDGGQRD